MSDAASNGKAAAYWERIAGEAGDGCGGGCAAAIGCGGGCICAVGCGGGYICAVGCGGGAPTNSSGVAGGIGSRTPGMSVPLPVGSTYSSRR